MSKPKVQPLPHSWLVNDWPATVSPGRPNAGKNLVRAHRQELIACGALVRIGRELTIIGEGYAQFLARKAGRVAGYDIAPNRRRHGLEEKSVEAASA
jgi:hypothetical protein